MQSFFTCASRLMKTGGLLTIFTDNLWYGKLLTRQLGASVFGSFNGNFNNKNKKNGISETKQKNKNKNKQQISTDTFTSDTGDDDDDNNSIAMHSLTMEYIQRHQFEGTWEEEFVYQSVVLFKGSPGKECGHIIEASSYFDRLWKLKDDKSDRYMIVLQKK